MQAQYTISVIHPAFETLKRSARFLHLVAGCIILYNALHQWYMHEAVLLILITQLILAADIFLLVFFGGGLLQESPRVNLVFRLFEVLVIMGIGSNLLVDGHQLAGVAHLFISAGFGWLLYREYRMLRSESIQINPTGISIPNFLRDWEISWSDIQRIEPHYHSIFIETNQQQKFQFQLRQNLKIEELQQIDEFCRQHLPAGS